MSPLKTATYQRACGGVESISMNVKAIFEAVISIGNKMDAQIDFERL